MATRELGRTMGFEAEVDDEVGDELVKNLLRVFEGVGDIAMGVEEMLHCRQSDGGATGSAC